MNTTKLIKELSKEYEFELDMLRDEENEDSIMDILPTKALEIVKKYSKLLSLSPREYKVLTNRLYGEYSYCLNIEEVKFYMVLDFLEFKLVGDVYKNIAQFKKSRLENSIG